MATRLGLHHPPTLIPAHPAARALFDGLDAANRFAILYRVQQAKGPDRRAAKIAALVGMLSRGETLHPRKAKRPSPSQG